jgi:hypothetical protein
MMARTVRFLDLNGMLSHLKKILSRWDSPGSFMDFAREWRRLTHEGEALLGASGWALLRGYGRLMSGPYSGQYVSALPHAEVRALLHELHRGEQIPVHLMHRHRSGLYESSSLSLAEGRLLMHYPDRTEPAE